MSVATEATVVNAGSAMPEPRAIVAAWGAEAEFEQACGRRDMDAVVGATHPAL